MKPEPAIVDEEGNVIGDAALHSDMLDDNPEGDAAFEAMVANQEKSVDQVTERMLEEAL